MTSALSRGWTTERGFRLRSSRLRSLQIVQIESAVAKKYAAEAA